MNIDPGASYEHEFNVEGRLLTDVGGTLGVRLLSTAGMIAMMEVPATILAARGVPEGHGSVGFEVCVKHVAGAVEGARCVSVATLREVVDGRKLRFDVEVREGERTLGIGTHERRVIDLGAHAQAAGS